MNLKYLFAFFFLAILPAESSALQPHEVVIVANDFVSESVELAHYYMKTRNIPPANLIKVNLKPSETITREKYLNDIAYPIRQTLAKHPNSSSIRCLVTMTGLPLIVTQPELTELEKKQIDTLGQTQQQIHKKLSSLAKTEVEQIGKLKIQIDDLVKKIQQLKRLDERASLDSELTLLKLDNYELSGWLRNPFFIPFQDRKDLLDKDQLLMVSRLDGPSKKVIHRMIRDSLNAEENGLRGKAYFDARYQKANGENLKSYALYDNSLHVAAETVELSGKMPIVINDENRLFGVGEAPDAALYCGWYSLARYVDAFDWVPGAIGYHIASQECQTLRGNGKFWCKSLLEDGAAATIGPVAEPYLYGFPVPEIFFKLLVDGYYTLAEVYFLSLPHLSWQMVLLGDPLYRPFKTSN